MIWKCPQCGNINLNLRRSCNGIMFRNCDFKKPSTHEEHIRRDMKKFIKYQREQDKEIEAWHKQIVDAQRFQII